MRERIIMPSVGVYRSIPVHDYQSPQRIELVVVPHIDEAIAAGDDPARLLAILRRIDRAPEARIYCGRKLLAPMEAAKDARQRTKTDPDLLRALMTCREFLDGQLDTHYAGRFDTWGPRAGGHSQPAERPEPFRSQIREAAAAARVRWRAGAA